MTGFGRGGFGGERFGGTNGQPTSETASVQVHPPAVGGFGRTGFGGGRLDGTSAGGLSEGLAVLEGLSISETVFLAEVVVIDAEGFVDDRLEVSESISIVDWASDGSVQVASTSGRSIPVKCCDLSDRPQRAGLPQHSARSRAR